MTEILIREARVEDAVPLLELKTALDRETSFMMFEPDERSSNVDAERQAIADAIAQRNSLILIADSGRELAGYLEARGGEFRRNRHSVYIVVGVRSGYQGQGIGRRLFEVLDGWAAANAIHRLELTVMTSNEPAVRLYSRMGYEIEGTRRDSLLVDGEYVDEYQMARIIPTDFAAGDRNE